VNEHARLHANSCTIINIGLLYVHCTDGRQLLVRQRRRYINLTGNTENSQNDLRAEELTCVFFIGPITSTIVTRFGTRPITIAGGILVSVGFFASAFSPNIYVLFGTYGILIGRYCLCTKNNVENAKGDKKR
jgi:hypothetical protein